MSPSSGLRPRSRRATSTSALEEKIREMQGFFSLKQTGRLDLQTLSVMRKHRCGVPDVENYSFYPDQPKWKNHTITYRISQYTPDLTREEVDTSFRLALKIWSDAAPLKFIKVNHDTADIVLSFARKTHGDFFPFDGPKGVLAHAFEPGEGMGGDVHFDEDEIWTMGHRKLGYNLFTVAAHEFGHSLGLSHSKDPSSLMYPNYKYYNGAQYTLPRDDALGIQALYGKPVRKQDPPNLLKKCDPNFSVDAVALFGKEIVFFKNRYMWLRTTWTTYWNRLREGPSSTYLPSINSPVDAAYDIPAKGVAYVFTGPKYWVVRQLKMKSHFGSIYDYGFPARAAPASAPEVQTSPEDDETVAESIIKPDFNKSLEAMQAFFGLEVTVVLGNNTQIYTDTADIMILFKGGYHRDFSPFDGPNGVLAHANSHGRDQGGDTHFEDDETWTLSQRGVNLLLVAAHEFGHALGLDHSRHRRALMFPTYQYANTNGYTLPDDDRCRQDPKPEPEAEPEEPTENPKLDPKPDPKPDPRPNPKDKQCNRDLVFDAASSIRGDLLDFTGFGSKVDAVCQNFGYLFFSDGPRQSEYYLAFKRVIRVPLNYGWLDFY
ncbi:unnamed protein product [Coregonus sp. 'balchen']|nr:unnamed protein product [Coregonus sp. 'balchen']